MMRTYDLRSEDFYVSENASEVVVNFRNPSSNFKLGGAINMSSDLELLSERRMVITKSKKTFDSPKAVPSHLL